MTVGELIERLSRFDPSLPVGFEDEVGPFCDITEVNQTVLVFIRDGEIGQGVVIGNEFTAESLEEWVKEQREHHESYKQRFENAGC